MFSLCIYIYIHPYSRDVPIPVGLYAGAVWTVGFESDTYVMLGVRMENDIIKGIYMT